MNLSHYKTEAGTGEGSTASLTISLHSVQKKSYSVSNHLKFHNCSYGF